MSRVLSLWLAIVLLSGVWMGVGCQREPQRPPADVAPGTNDAAAADHQVVGRITSIAPDKSSVMMDHEDIPGVMPAMEMRFTVQDPQVLEGIEAGSHVEGRLRIEDGNYIITQLEER